MIETERALRAATCIGCANGLNITSTGCHIDGHICTYNPELLPLFQAATEQAGIEHDERWVDAMGWTDLVHDGPYTQSDRERYVNLLVESVTYNMHEEAPPEQIATAVAGAYVAAAKAARHAYNNAPDASMERIDRAVEAILALTPADARSKPPSMDDVENCSEVEYKLTADAQQALGEIKKHAVQDFIANTEKSLELNDYINSQLAAAIASAEARARLEEAKWWADGHHNVQNYVTCHLCNRLKEVTEAAARTPDSTKEQG